jgi:hypothetical protein
MAVCKLPIPARWQVDQIERGLDANFDLMTNSLAEPVNGAAIPKEISLLVTPSTAPGWLFSPGSDAMRCESLVTERAGIGLTVDTAVFAGLPENLAMNSWTRSFCSTGREDHLHE